MTKQFFHNFLLISLVAFLIFPQGVLAEITLSQEDTHNLLNAVQQGLMDEWIDLTTSPSFAEPEKQAALFLIRNAIQNKELEYILQELPLQALSNLVKITTFLLGHPEAGAFLERLEKESVEKAIEIAIDWLLQNEVKVASGSLTYSFTSYKGNLQESFFYYSLAYKYLINEYGEITIEFYSPEEIEPQGSTARAMWMKESYWEFADWQAQGNEKLGPFIVRIRGRVVKTDLGGYKWDKTLSAEVTFSEPIPEFPGGKPLTFWERMKQELIRSIVEKILPVPFELVEFFQSKLIGSVEPLEQTITEKEKSPDVEQETEPEGANELKSGEETKTEPQDKTKPTLQEIQELLDDIAERIDVISQETNELVGEEKPSTPEESEEEQEETTEEEIEEESEEEKEPEEKEEEKMVTICQRIPEDYPLRNKVIINEIAWMGTVNSANDEWIELKNISNEPINLSGWQLLDKDQQIRIIFVQEDFPHSSFGSFYLLERTDDDSVPNITADLIYTGGLSNTNEALYLFDENCQLQDEVVANPNWPNGNSGSKRTMERKSNLEWQTSAYIGGTPKGENSSGYIVIPSSYTPPPSPSYPKIFISEVRISPITERFVELYNPNNYTVDLTGWYIQRKIGDGSPSSFVSSPNFEGKIIGPLDYFLVAHSSSTIASSADILLNLTLTSNNTLLLKNPKKEIVDEINWEEIEEGLSYGRHWDETANNYLDEWEIQTPTPKTKNSQPPAEESQEEKQEEAPTLEVIINEIAWIGTRANSFDEWIELYNNTTSTIELAGWRLVSSDGEPDISFSTSTAATTTIPAQGFYLIERTDDDSISDIPADWVGIFGNGLKNNPNCEILFLYDQNNKLIDQTVCFENGDWPAGKASPDYITMERIKSNELGLSSENWASNNLITRNGWSAEDKEGKKYPINGTPGAPNSISISPTIISSLPFDEFINEITLTQLSSPYIIQQIIFVPEGKKLKINPGVILKFDDSTEIEVKGDLEAIGGEENKIIFMRNSTSTPPNDRYRIHFIGSLNSKIEKAKFLEGGRLTYVPFYKPWGIIAGVLDIENSQVSIKDSSLIQFFPIGILLNATSTIENVEFFGSEGSNYATSTTALLIGEGGSIIKNSIFRGNEIGIKISGNTTPKIENNIFENNDIPIYLSIPAYPFFLNNQAQDNNLNGIFVGGGDIIFDTIWQADLPYVVGPKSIQEEAILTLEKGTVVKFQDRSGYAGYFEVYGRIIAKGTLTDPVVFTSIYDDEFGGDTNNDGASTLPNQGDWSFLRFFASSSILDGSIIRYGDGQCKWGSCWGAITQLEGVELQIKNSIIEKNILGIFSNETNCEKTFEKIRFENVHFSENERDISLIGGEACPPP